MIPPVFRGRTTTKENFKITQIGHLKKTGGVRQPHAELANWPKLTGAASGTLPRRRRRTWRSSGRSQFGVGSAATGTAVAPQRRGLLRSSCVSMSGMPLVPPECPTGNPDETSRMASTPSRQAGQVRSPWYRRSAPQATTRRRIYEPLVSPERPTGSARYRHRPNYDRTCVHSNHVIITH